MIVEVIASDLHLLTGELVAGNLKLVARILYIFRLRVFFGDLGEDLNRLGARP